MSVDLLECPPKDDVPDAQTSDVASKRFQRLWRWFISPTVQTKIVTWGAIALSLGLVRAASSTAVVVIVSAICATVWLLGKWAKKHPQAAGTIFPVGLMIAVATMASLVMAPVYIADGAVELAAGFVLAPIVVAVATWLFPSYGTHRGWTTFLALIPAWVGFAATVTHPGLVSVAACVSTVGGVLVAWVRSRLGKRTTGVVSTPRTRRKRIVRGVAMAGVVVTMVTMGSLAAGPKAEAGWFSNIGDKMLCGIVAPSLGSEPVGTGPEQVIASYNNTGLGATDGSEAPYLDRELDFNSTNLDAYTLYEIAGLRGISYVNWVKDDAGENTGCAFTPWISIMAGNALNMIAHFGLQITIFLMEFSQVKDPFRFLYEPLSPIVGNIVLISLAFMGIAFIIGIIIGLYRLVRRGSLAQALQGASGATIAAMICALFYGGVGAGAIWEAPKGSGFYTLMSTLDEYAATLSAEISSSLLSYVPQADSGMCNYPTGGDNTSLRYASCILAESMAYYPWALGQFGPAGADVITPVNDPNLKPTEGGNVADKNELGLPCYNNYQGCGDIRSYLIAQVGGPSADIQACLRESNYDEEANDVDNFDALTSCEPYHAVANDLTLRGTSDSDLMLSSYRGSGGSSAHATQAFVSLLSIFTVGLAIAAVSAAATYWHGRLLMLFFLGPFRLLGAAFTSVEKSFQWVMSVMQTAIVRVCYSVAVALMIVIVATVAASPLNAGIQLLINVVLIGSILKGIRAIDQYTSVGTDGGGDSSQVTSKANVISGSAIGTAAGNLATGAIKGGAAGTGRVVGGAAKKTGTGALAVGGAGVAAAGFATRPLQNANERRRGRADSRREQKAMEAEGKQQKTTTETSSDTPTKTPSRVRTTVTNAGAAVGRSFKRPDGVQRERAHSEQDIYQQEVKKENGIRKEQGRDILTPRERFKIRRNLGSLNDVDLHSKYESADQRASRLAETVKKREAAAQGDKERANKRNPDQKPARKPARKPVRKPTEKKD
ncbi:hypothetical protein [Corynebacterium crudilactis]|uniref:Uncharacterized protein n=1 Tax=Corynebacterium crudilactis TaxID=1652495 RepID=A0A172QY20_9CORY|nr:hypothetical protein [Corynebacterium crudilactis]ANE05538.1 hypothetical protein ccrud_14455 [Corynebacterium crudilactis]